eukprot:TRINITY_DN43326_c0_g2_i2.p1 TRINITY_DN43326_c0_g2~~TRINITY_DN43326_c0_g2_i2.p1  ORF type:complete len:105 (+),score=28.40 TRINITY_DN43326_c0_g2_i2:100-414(+)
MAESSVQSEMDMAQKARSQTSSSWSQTRTSGWKERPVSDDWMERFRDYSNRGSRWSLTFQHDPLPVSQEDSDCLQRFMGRVKVRDNTATPRDEEDEDGDGSLRG